MVVKLLVYKIMHQEKIQSRHKIPIYFWAVNINVTVFCGFNLSKVFCLFHCTVSIPNSSSTLYSVSMSSFFFSKQIYDLCYIP